jgi:H+-transporting ATPase
VSDGTDSTRDQQDTKAEAPGAAQQKTEAVPLSEWLERRDASMDGLSQEEVEHRLDQYGHNEIREEEVNPILKFLSYFWGPIPWMIEIAAVFSAVPRHWLDLGVIMALLILNAVVGFFQEHQAANEDWAKMHVYHLLGLSGRHHRSFLDRLQEPLHPHGS